MKCFLVTAFAAVMAFCFVVATGCTTTAGRHRMGGDSGYTPRNQKERLDAVAAVGSRSVGRITVYYPAGLDSQARQLAELVNWLFADLETSTGFRMAFDEVHIYLKRVPVVDAKADFCFYEEGNSIGLFLYVKKEDTSVEEIIGRNWLFPGAFVHEVVEGSLSRPSDGLPLRLDYLTMNAAGTPTAERHFTRWFREGFADYAAVLAHRAAIVRHTPDPDEFPKAILDADIQSKPFSALDRIGADLFKWTQFGPDLAMAKVDPERELEYYSAALGLFLVVEDRYGRDVIREIIESVNATKRLEGAELIEVCNDTLHVDIIQLAGSFSFPRLGLDMEEFYPGNHPLPLGATEGLYVRRVEPGSPAERAGVREGDAILSVDGDSTVTNLDFEMVVYRRMKQASVTLGAWREGKGDMKLPLLLPTRKVCP